jgi:hypothetical protein
MYTECVYSLQTYLYEKHISFMHDTLNNIVGISFDLTVRYGVIDAQTTNNACAQ